MDKRILIGVPTAEFARRADFYDYLNAMTKPEGSGMTVAHGQSPARNRNIIIDQALQHNFTHVFFLDDDVVFQQDLLMKLSMHDVDAVSGLYLMRNYPHRPIIFDTADSFGRCVHTVLTPEKKGLIPVVAAGLGCLLVNLDVFRKMEKPWITMGELEKDHWCDDISFFKRFREAGFQAYCDLSCVVGHFATVTLWPDYIDGMWHTTYDSYGTGRISAKQLQEHEITLFEQSLSQQVELKV